MQKSLKDIAKLIDGEVIGDGGILIKGVAGIREASEGDITFLANPRYLPLIDKTRASAIITAKDVTGAPKPIVRVNNPSLAFAKVVSTFSPSHTMHPKGIDQRAALGKNLTLGKGVAVGPYAVIEDNCVIGDNTIIYCGCFIGRDTTIGSDTLIYPNVTIRECVKLGSRVIIHSGTVIGSDGFGYATINGLHQKIPQVGTVEIGDDVEIGANVTIDRARFDKTIVGRGTKIDNLVQIAHNVAIGENSIIVAQAGISGSTTIGNNVTLAGQVGVVGHVSIGDEAVVMAQAGVSKSVPPKTMVWGYPAKPVEIAKRVNAGVQNLPRLYRSVAELKQKIAELESKLKEK
ncbi:MAG: UDP-3-O-(3-hydroxymyristoyl)glucosamine N-acyltransferase [Omnitrophica WOR_2 bacterium RBG_13_44_8b]|nr:MAG: UDP-3-O-(3-hydroxymyristoyl)glucosamine N-acyltransferase [Omnitrophica WOR_2 bacterium RBG_13_44_8b]